MEFEDEHDEEQEEEEDDDDDDDEQGINISPPSLMTPPSYNSPRVNPERRSGVVRYRECLKNHAVNIGGHALDGCGEFMPAGDDGTLNALKCAACNCHRNFHRKEIHAVPSSAAPFPPQFSAYYRTPAPPPPPGYLHVSSAPPHHRQLAVVPSSSHSGEMDDGGKKRFRTKFTAEQKDKMLEFAEKLGWRIQKHDDVAIQQFCDELQIRRQVLKVWMHNNKLTHAKKP